MGRGVRPGRGVRLLVAAVAAACSFGCRLHGVRVGLVERGGAVLEAWRDPLAGAGVWGVTLSVAAGPGVSCCWRLTSGDLKGFRRVALAASIRRRLASWPPGVWNDILRIAIEVYSRLSQPFCLAAMLCFGESG